MSKKSAWKKGKKESEKRRTADLEKAVNSFIAPPSINSFAVLPLSLLTQRGLKSSFFIEPTEIQSLAIPPALKGRDVLAAARTGSGKTLAFLVPVLDVLFRKKWGPTDGLGALVISPTRELAVQIFHVLRQIGRFHSFSAGIVIGGKSVKDERERLGRMNILIATPGRLLQHLDQAVGFACDNLQILVLDEADRILDLGFEKTLTALLGHLPKTRQTLLFSATQSAPVAALARLSLVDPLRVDAHPAAGLSSSPNLPTSSSSTSTLVTANTAESPLNPTPPTLTQFYLPTPLPKKLPHLLAFLRTHPHAKTLVFLSTSAQVKFVYETFRTLRPGVVLMALWGRMKVGKRMAVVERFAKIGGESKVKGKERGKGEGAVLLATDVAARGLDFPCVDWVIQVDVPSSSPNPSSANSGPSPEALDTYIHRVGRTARAGAPGNALIFLGEKEEESWVSGLARRGIRLGKRDSRDVKKDSGREGGKRDLAGMLGGLVFRDVRVKYLAQRAFISYLRSLYHQGGRDLTTLPLEEYAVSLGLAGMPKVRFLKKTKTRMKGAGTATNSIDESGEEDENASEEEDEDEDSSDESEKEDEAEEGEEEKTENEKIKPQVRTKYDRMFGRKNQGVLSAHYAKLVDQDATFSTKNGKKERQTGLLDELGGEEGEDFITLKRADHDIPFSSPGSYQQSKTENLSNRFKKLSKTQRLLRTAPGKTKLVFDENGEAKDAYMIEDVDTVLRRTGGREGMAEEGRKFAEGERGRMGEAQKKDREEAREKRRERKRRRKEKESGGWEIGGGAVVLGGEGEDGYVSPVFDVGESEGESEEEKSRVRKKRKREKGRGFQLEDDERMALEVLRRK